MLIANSLLTLSACAVELSASLSMKSDVLLVCSIVYVRSGGFCNSKVFLKDYRCCFSWLTKPKGGDFLVEIGGLRVVVRGITAERDGAASGDIPTPAIPPTPSLLSNSF